MMPEIIQKVRCKEKNCEKHVHCTECGSGLITWEPLTDWAYCRSCRKEFKT